MFGTSAQTAAFQIQITLQISRYGYSNLRKVKSDVCGRVITDSLTESLTDFLTDFRLVRESEKRPRTCVWKCSSQRLLVKSGFLTRTRDA